MSLEQIVQIPFQRWVQDIYWPRAGQGVAGGAWDVAGSAVDGDETTATNLWSATAGGGSSTMVTRLNLACGRLDSTAGQEDVELIRYTHLNQNALTAGVVLPEPLRLWWAQWLWSWDTAGGVPTGNSGVCFALNQTGGSHWVDATAGSGAGISIIGDGAGGLNFARKNLGGAGAPDEIVALAVPGGVLTAWIQVDVLMYGATATSPVRYRILFNGVEVLARSGAANVPTYGAGLGAFVMHLRVNDGAASIQHLAGLRIRQGKWDFNGTELRGT